MKLGIGIGLGYWRNSGFSPSALFAAGEQGAWYDPSDISSMSQDDAGATPVTAAGQTVGRILDKSGRGNHATQATLGSRPTYQVVSGLPCLVFNGSSNFLVTPTITPGTDKAQVFAGVRKLTDSGLLSIIGHSASPGSDNGTFEHYYNAGGENSNWLSRGTSNGTANVPSGSAPISNVITGLMDISGDSIHSRSNGTQVSSVEDQGTGNYLAYPMYIGGRAGTSLFLNANLYGLIVRFGSNLSAAQVTATEAYIAGKTGVTL